MRLGEALRANLPAGGLGERLYVFESIDSTNAFALRLAEDGEADGTAVVAEAQTVGRGRGGSRWHSPSGSSLSLSVILRPAAWPGLRFGGLGALATAQALEGLGLEPRIKWPNDVLLSGRKVAGVLAEGSFSGDQPDFVVLGIGVNLRPGAWPAHERLDFPATAIASETARPVSLLDLSLAILESMQAWYGLIDTPHFVEGWRSRLAYAGEWVRVETGQGAVEGRLLGLEADGAARVETASGVIVRCGGEARRLRPVDRRPD